MIFDPSTFLGLNELKNYCIKNLFIYLFLGYNFFDLFGLFGDLLLVFCLSLCTHFGGIEGGSSGSPGK
jgi:hypothetical protein